MKSLIAACAGLVMASQVSALDMPDNMVDVRNRFFEGTVIGVKSPNVIQVRTKKHDEYVHFFLDLADVNFAADTDFDCSADRSTLQKYVRPGATAEALMGRRNACERTLDELEDAHVQVEVTNWTQPHLKGYLFKDGENYNHSLIDRGLYRVNFEATRQASLLLMEGRARCKRIGIWSGLKGNQIEDKKCQESFIR